MVCRQTLCLLRANFYTDCNPSWASIEQNKLEKYCRQCDDNEGSEVADTEDRTGPPLPGLQVHPGDTHGGHGGRPHLAQVLGGAGHGHPGGDGARSDGGLLPVLSYR